MSQPELLRRVVEVLDAVRIGYLVTGSLASGLQGEARATHDIDLVVALEESGIENLLQAFSEPDYYLSREAILDAIQQKSMFNLLSLRDGDKVDFWLLTDEPFDRSRFSRRYVEEYDGMRLQVSSPEDTILAKLRWAKLAGGSEKQFTDALRVYEVQAANLDLNYLNSWAGLLDIEADWQRLQAEAEPI